jgi:hypothetical protein
LYFLNAALYFDSSSFPNDDRDGVAVAQPLALIDA